MLIVILYLLPVSFKINDREISQNRMWPAAHAAKEHSDFSRIRVAVICMSRSKFSENISRVLEANVC